MTTSATRRDELRRLVEKSRTATDTYQQALHEVRNAVPDLLDEIERLEAESSKWHKAGADGIDSALEHGVREIERLRTELGEATLVIEQQDQDLERLRTALGDALDWWSPGELESSDARDTHDRLRKVLG